MHDPAQRVGLAAADGAATRRAHRAGIHGLGAFLAYGIGGLAVPLVLLFWWLRFRRLRASTGNALHHG